MDEAEQLQQRINYWQGLIQDHLEYQTNGGHKGTPRWTAQPGTPYGVRRGSHLRGGGAAGSFRHRTLIVNSPATGLNMPSDAPPTPGSNPTPPDHFVSTNGRHKQLINSNVYDRIAQQKREDMAETWTARQQEKADREAARLQAYFAKTQAHTDSQNHEVVVNGIRFQITDSGSKLVNILRTPAKLIPHKTKIGGVTFIRSKNGNLYRSGIVKPKQWVQGSHHKGRSLTDFRPTQQHLPELCKIFSSTGSCPHGPACHFVHDPDKVAICKTFLQRGTCPAGDYCDLSHDPSPHRSPACVHFLRGACTNEDCRYAHVKVNAGAPVCRAFAIWGYCEKGATCSARHVTECPDYANTGVCYNPSCRLPHMERAAKLRKAATMGSSGNTPSPSKDPEDTGSSSEDDLPDDVDSDDDIFIQGVEGAGQDLTGNNDFVGLSQ